MTLLRAVFLKKNAYICAVEIKQLLTGRRRWGTPSHYRLDFVKENTLNRVWTLRFTRVQVIVASIIVVAATLALLWAIARFTPVGRMLPGASEEMVRNSLVELGIRVDSLQNRQRISGQYIENLRAVLSGKPGDNRVSSVLEQADTLIGPGVNEREFVAGYNPADHYSMSVLTPIVAESMVFFSPLSHARVVSAADVPVAVMEVADTQAVVAVYPGTVVSVGREAGGYTVMIQHSNNFISVYSGLENTFVKKDSRVEAGQAIGVVGSRMPLQFEMWHDGRAVSPDRLISL